jgi:hypothetical protein
VIDLSGDDPAVLFSDLADELCERDCLLRTSSPSTPAVQAEEEAHLKVDEHQIARSLPGVAKIGAPSSSPTWVVRDAFVQRRIPLLHRPHAAGL